MSRINRCFTDLEIITKERKKIMDNKMLEI